MKVILTVPKDFGELQITGGGMAPTGADILSTAGESAAEYVGPMLSPGAAQTFRVVHDFAGSDNVYRVSSQGERVGDLPLPDRFDVDDPAVNPPESRPNNDEAERGLHLGEGEFDWVAVDCPLDVLGDVCYEINIPDLNFHQPGDPDRDWFEITSLPPVESFPDVPGCRPRLRVDESYDDDTQAQSYDLRSSGLSTARFVQVRGAATGPCLCHDADDTTTIDLKDFARVQRGFVPGGPQPQGAC